MLIVYHFVHAECSAEGAARLAQKLVEWVWRYFDDTPANSKGSTQLKPDQPVTITGDRQLTLQYLNCILPCF